MKSLSKIFYIGCLILNIQACNDDKNSNLPSNPNNTATDNSQNTVNTKNLAAESYSKEFNVTTDEADRRLNIMGKADEIHQKLKDNFGSENISSIYFDNKADFKVGLRVVGVPISNIQSINLSDGSTVPLKVEGNQKRNSEEIEKLIDDNLENIKKKAGENIAVGFDSTNNRVMVDVYTPKSIDGNTDGQTANTFSKTIYMNVDELSNEIPVVANLSNIQNKSIALIQNKIIGGGLINSPNACTVGFVGYRNGVAGFMTATHCANNTLYQGNDGKSFTLYPSSTYNDFSANHEMSFMPVPNAPLYGGVYKDKDLFFDTSILKIKSLHTQPVSIGSTYLCHMGRTTGYSCGSVVSAGVSNNAVNDAGEAVGCNSKYSANYNVKSQPCARTFVQLSGSQLACSKGDSGGPVFDEKTGEAYGIVSSAQFTGNAKGQCNILTFSQLDYASTMGFTLSN